MAPFRPTESRSRNGSLSQSDPSDSSQQSLRTNSRIGVLKQAEKKLSSSSFKLFTRQGSQLPRSKATTVGGAELDSPKFDRMDRLDGLRGIVKPCPFIKPLEHKLEPREERSTLRRPTSGLNQDQVLSAITIARMRGETVKLLNSRATDDNLDAIKEEGIEPKDFFERLATSLMNQSSISPEEITVSANRLSANSQDSKWLYYMQCYIKGQFNITNPPDPPSLGLNFEYLPALKPPNEEERILVSRQFEILWPKWGNEKSGALLRAAMTKFDTPYASISIFDDVKELFKAENGFHQPEIDREISIAAHVLYTNEVIVVLDTQRDWRFAGNPLVKGQTCIRFFAGAPLLSAEGLAMGVFAVWSKEPRANFIFPQRRDLAEFGALVMTDLTLQMRRLSDPELQEVPILQGQFPLRDRYRTESPEESLIDLDAATNFGPALMPQALRYHGSSMPPNIEQQTHSRSSVTSRFVARTPPPSIDSGDGMLNINRNGSGGSPSTGGNLGCNPGRSPRRGPTLKEIQDSGPRPFSSSDLTSHYPLPPNTPDGSLVGEDFSNPPEFDLDQFPAVPEPSYFEDFQEPSNEAPRTFSEFSTLPPGADNNTTDETVDTNTDWSRSDKSSDYNASESVISDSPQRAGLFSRRDFYSQIVYEDENSTRLFDQSETPPKNTIQFSTSRKSTRTEAFVPPIQNTAQVSSSSIEPDAPTLQPKDSSKSAKVPGQKSIPGQSTEHSNDLYPKNFESTSPVCVMNGASPKHARILSQYMDSVFSRALEPGVQNSDSADGLSAPFSPSWESSQATAEAAHACATFARQADYDFIYVAEIKPAPFAESDDQLLSPGGMSKRILTAYGLNQRLDLSSSTHLRVLRCRGSEHWENSSVSTAELDFQNGYLIPILVDETVARKARSSGIVMGAFRKARAVVMKPDRDEELKQLMKFSETLKGLLKQAARSWPSKKDLMEPNSPRLDPFPANVATEVKI